MEQKYLTLDDLAQFTEEVLLPGMERMIEPLHNEIVEMRKEFRAEFDGIHQELADIHSEIHSIRLDLDSLEIQVTRLEKMTKEDLNVYADDIIKVKKDIKHLELRINAIGV